MRLERNCVVFPCRPVRTLSAVAMAELKTKKNDASVAAFLDTVDDPKRRADCWALVELMQDVTRMPPAMWGTSIIGFGSYRYEYKSGRTGEWFVVGFSPRKRNLTLYLMGGLKALAPILERMGTHSCGKGCLYLKRLSDHDPAILRELVEASVLRLEPQRTDGA